MAIYATMLIRRWRFNNSELGMLETVEYRSRQTGDQYMHGSIAEILIYDKSLDRN